MVVEVQQAEKRATRRFALRLPVSVNYSGNTGAALAAQTRHLLLHGRAVDNWLRDRVYPDPPP